MRKSCAATDYLWSSDPARSGKWLVLSLPGNRRLTDAATCQQVFGCVLQQSAGQGTLSPANRVPGVYPEGGMRTLATPFFLLVSHSPYSARRPQIRFGV